MRVRSDFVKGHEEFIRQKSQFSQFWTFTPIISTLLEHMKINIMAPKNYWKVVYYINDKDSIEHNIGGYMTAYGKLLNNDFFGE